MAEFKVRKAYYRLMVDTEFELHQESDYYYAYLDAKKSGHYFAIEIMPWMLEGFYHRLQEYIDTHRERGMPQMVRSAYKMMNQIVDLIGDPLEVNSDNHITTHVQKETEEDSSLPS